MRCWLKCLSCGTKELLVDTTKFDGGCLHCGGGPRSAESDDGAPMFVWSEQQDLTSWSVTNTGSSGTVTVKTPHVDTVIRPGETKKV